MSRAPFLFLVFAACGNNPGDPIGEPMQRYFPFDENIDCRWEFINSDNDVRYRLIGEIDDIRLLDTGNEYTTAYKTECILPNDPDCANNETIRRLTVAADFRGVRVTAIDGVAFDTPVRFASDSVFVGDTEVTTTNGETYTVTYAGLGECPVEIPNWDQCARFDVVSESGAGSLVGSYWAIQAFNFVAFDWADQPGEWRLTTHVILD